MAATLQVSQWNFDLEPLALGAVTVAEGTGGFGTSGALFLKSKPKPSSPSGRDGPFLALKLKST